MGAGTREAGGGYGLWAQSPAAGWQLHILAAAVLLTACEFDKVSVQETATEVALHGVLSATARTQVVLLERTRNGSVVSYELADSLVSPAVAEENAVVQLLTPDGRTLTAVEDRVAGGNKGFGFGAGVYRFALPGNSLVRGLTYELRVQTAAGETLRGETVVPAGTGAMAAPSVFNRATDTLRIEWPASAGARSYFVRVETPFGPRTFFTDSTSVLLTGDLRNADLDELPHVFIPGFPQAVTVSAVDSNYYDWFRTRNERVSGTGVVNRIQGGIGVFGSLVRLHFDSLSVVAPRVEPVEGRFEFLGDFLERTVTPNLALELYVESHSARADQPDALSGNYDRRPFLGMEGCVTCGLLGTAKNGHVELALLVDWYARDTSDVFVGDIRGDTIVGKYRRLGFEARFVRQPPP